MTNKKGQSRFPLGMTNKKQTQILFGNDSQEGKDNSKNKQWQGRIQGFFAALRMTGSVVGGPVKGKCKGRSKRRFPAGMTTREARARTSKGNGAIQGSFAALRMTRFVVGGWWGAISMVWYVLSNVA
jgi:hypothetical protein